MHELSIALSMIEMASEEALNRRAQVSALHLKLGPLSGVIKDALLFSYEIACQGTPLEGSRLVIQEVPVKVRCSQCQTDNEVETLQSLRCPKCESLNIEVIEGRELEVVALEIEEELAEVGGGEGWQARTPAVL